MVSFLTTPCLLCPVPAHQVGLVSRDGLDASNLLLRGCTLRKTEWVIGVVVFTGARVGTDRHVNAR